MIWETENRPCIQVWEDNSSEISLATFFMADSVSVNRIMPQVKLVASFCPDSALEQLKSKCPSVSSTLVSLLDDRTNDGERAPPREYLGPLNVHQLYLELTKKVR